MILDGTKIGLYQDRIKDYCDGYRIAPITVDMALTRACNLRCVYCYGQLQENVGNSLSAETISGLMQDFAEIGVKGVSLVSDGESTCSPHLKHAIFEAHNNRLKCALGTNGVLFNRPMIISTMPFLSYLRFNVSAGTKERYNEIMRPGDPEAWDKLIENIKYAVEHKRKWDLDCTIGMQMVLMPQFSDQIIPLSKLAVDLGVDYLIIKHCSDDESGTLEVDYSKYTMLESILATAEGMSTDKTAIVIKWSKLKDANIRQYKQCYGPPFIIQLSGSGLVAPCGMFFADKYKEYHIGNVNQTRFKDIWKSDRYWEVMHKLSSPNFNAQTMCGCLCLQHSVNKAIDRFINHGIMINCPSKNVLHKEFV